jgi:hypothetical protein
MKTTFVFPSTPVFLSNRGKPIVQFTTKKQQQSGSVKQKKKAPKKLLQKINQLNQKLSCTLFSQIVKIK